MNITEEFDKIFGFCFCVSIKTSKAKSNNRAETWGSLFFTKIVLTGHSLYCIFHPKPTHYSYIKDEIPIEDFTSALILDRNLFESYVFMYYLLIDPKSEEEREFRLDLWDRHGRSEEIDMLKSLNARSNLISERKQWLEEIDEKIKNSNYYNNLSQFEKTVIEKPYKWIVFKNKKDKDKGIYYLSEIAKIDSFQARYFYKYLSNYAHTQSYALAEMTKAENKSKRQFCWDKSKSFASMYLSLSLDCFGDVSPLVKEILKNQKEINDIIKYYQDEKQKPMIYIE